MAPLGGGVGRLKYRASNVFAVSLIGVPESERSISSDTFAAAPAMDMIMLVSSAGEAASFSICSETRVMGWNITEGATAGILGGGAKGFCGDSSGSGSLNQSYSAILLASVINGR